MQQMTQINVVNKSCVQQ